MKILFIDIETSPAICYTYDLFQPVISHKQIISPSRIICFSAQWSTSKKTLFHSEYHDTREGMLKALYDLLDEADVVVGYNSKRFDTPWIEGELLVEGFGRPSPFKQIDLYQVVKQHARFLSKKLDYVSERLLGDKKIDVNTMMLAIECVYGPEEDREKAWNKMRRYSKKDTALMLPLFDILRPYIKMPHPVNESDPNSCHTCGSTNLQRRGYSLTLTGRYQRFACQDCGSWFRGVTRHPASDIRALS